MSSELPPWDRTVMARWLAYLSLAGGATAVLSTAMLPIPAGSQRLGSLVLGLMALATGGTILALHRRLPGWGLPVLLAVGTLEVSLGIYFWGVSPTDDAMFYVWIALYAACFFDRGMAAAQLAVVGAAYAGVLFAQGTGPAASTRWAVTMITLAVSGTVISLLVRQLRQAMAGMQAAAADRERLMAQLETAALTDELTGLPNRRAWEAEFTRELARARRGESEVSVALLDVDRFKAYNDRHGHRAGDELLHACSGAWRDQLRGADVLARVGGDEFAILLPDCGPDDALGLIERLRVATPPPSTVSAGIAVWNYLETCDDLLDRADAALYEAKAQGRARAVLRRPAATT
jgi:diguanylate cyclase (GGDEF)-like protein